MELNVQKSDQDWGQLARARLQEEVDELRALMDAKIGEETRRTEVEKSEEQELADLRSQVAGLQADLSEARKLGLESQSKLKVELDNLVRAHNFLRETYKKPRSPWNPSCSQYALVRLTPTVIWEKPFEPKR